MSISWLQSGDKSMKTNVKVMRAGSRVQGCRGSDMNDGKMVREKFVYSKHTCRNENLRIVEKLSLKVLNTKVLFSSEKVGPL